jgi:outer membrane protein assembly factor BamB
MRVTTVALALAMLSLGAPARAGEPKAPYPAAIGEHVDPAATGHWPVRVRSLDRVAWRFSEGQFAGMAVPGPEDLVYVQAGGGGVRAVRSGTGERVWIGTGNWSFFNYSTCVTGADGTVYGGNFGSLSAMARDGTLRWQTDLDASWIHRPPALSPDGKRLYLGSDNLEVACVDAATGSVLWARRDVKSPWMPCCFEPSGAFIASIGDRVVCIDREGKDLWSMPGGRGHLLLAGNALVMVCGALLEAFDSDTRARLWKVSVEADVAGMALGDDGRILLSFQSGSLASVAADGKLRWRRKLSEHALGPPATTQGGETLVVDGAGFLFLCDSNGEVISKIDTGGAPWRWRPSVGRDGRVYVNHANDVVCIDGAERAAPRPLVATDLTIVAADFVVDLWVSGRKVPVDHRHALGSKSGPGSERVALDVRKGDWLAFQVAASPLRRGGSGYFGLVAMDAAGHEVFRSECGSEWSACDDPGSAPAFIAERGSGAEQAAVSPAVPWASAAALWQRILKRDFTGEPLWGSSASPWLKWAQPPEQP